MATSGRGSGMVAYNVQTAVDTTHHLIIAHEVVNVGTDRSQLAVMGKAAKLALQSDTLDVVADRGYSSHGLRKNIWDLGARPAIPPKQNEAPVACPDWIYTHRNQVERLWARLKEWRAIATRYEKTANSFMGVLCMAAAIDWIKG